MFLTWSLSAFPPVWVWAVPSNLVSVVLGMCTSRASQLVAPDAHLPPPMVVSGRFLSPCQGGSWFLHCITFPRSLQWIPGLCGDTYRACKHPTPCQSFLPDLSAIYDFCLSQSLPQCLQNVDFSTQILPQHFPAGSQLGNRGGESLFFRATNLPQFCQVTQCCPDAMRPFVAYLSPSPPHLVWGQVLYTCINSV